MTITNELIADIIETLHDAYAEGDPALTVDQLVELIRENEYGTIEIIEK